MSERTLPRIRSPKEAAAELKKLDPQTAIREHHIRFLMHSGAVPMIRAGRRIFVNLDTLIEYLASHPTLDLTGETQEEKDTPRGIRAVPDKMPMRKMI